MEDLIVFEGDASFVKVRYLSPSLTAPRLTFIQAADRVHVLKFSSSSARSFFWHQDPDPSHDDERARKVNELIGGTLEEPESGAMDVEG